MNNSTKFVEVYIISCHSCNKTFYEFAYSELENCPHCDADMIEGACSIEFVINTHIQIDSKTGEIREI